MKRGFYRRLAWTGIRQNRKLYMPYLLTCIGMIMMTYIVSFLSVSPVLQGMAGGATMQSILNFGIGVMGVFSLVFLFYTNSFLLRRRKKEFGLYNILGMGKRNLAYLMLWETLLVAGISLIAGLGAGIALSKFAELVMVRILSGTATFTLAIEPASLQYTMAWFGGIFLLLYLNALRQLRRSNPMELFRSEQAGEKPPKANWVLAAAGIILLGIAYYLAITIEDPVSALVLFFVAVVLVILATYLLFMAGSVAVCRLLQKNKNYYYRTNHFVSVSSMLYRMKRNGAGLASICILCTMVLVTLSTTVCLYVGLEDSLQSQHPRQIGTYAYVTDPAMLYSEKTEQVRQLASRAAEEAGLEPENTLEYRTAGFVGILNGAEMAYYTDNLYATTSPVDTTEYWQVYLIPLEDYNRIHGTSETLNPGEAILCTSEGDSYPEATIHLHGGEPLAIRKQTDTLATTNMDTLEMFATMQVVVPDFVEQASGLTARVGEDTLPLNLRWYYGFDLNSEDETQLQVYKAYGKSLGPVEAGGDSEEYFNIQTDSVAESRTDTYGLYGGLLFLGILLGIVFLFAAVLIIYYKQISEGYEDQSRFAIMQNVGMTKREIRGSINSQILTVFFLPLITAGIHLIFAFPMLYRMLILFSLTNRLLLIQVTGTCFLLFALFYVLVYRGTSRAYYSIVSGARER